MTVKIAVVGAGAWGKNLIRNFWNLGVLHTICELNQDSLRKLKSMYNEAHFASDFHDVLKNPDINAVVIATPAHTHYDIAKSSFLANKHVYVEKPLALEINHATELITLAKKFKKHLMVGHILRYHPAVIKLKELIDNGELGKIQYIYSNRLNIGKIRTEENILWSFAPHDISVILFLLDEQPELISATGGNYLQSHIADVTLTTMNFSSGVRSHIFVSWLHPYKEQKFVVVGNKKMAVFDDMTEEKVFLYPHKIEWQNRIPVVCKADAEVVQLEMQEPLSYVCQHFIECIQHNNTPITDGNEGLRVLKILSAAQRSLNTDGQKVILNNQITESAFPEGTKILADVFIHPTAFVAEGARIGKGVKIWNHSQIQSGAQIGEDCVIGHNCFVGSKAKLGNGVKLESNVDVWDLVTLEDYVFVGPSATFTNDINPRARYPKKKFPSHGKWMSTLVREGASIGANATIVCGITVGKYALIGAGAVVTKDIPDYAISVGVPSKIIGHICECGTKLEFKKDKAKCSTCDRSYYQKHNKVKIQK